MSNYPLLNFHDPPISIMELADIIAFCRATYQNKYEYPTKFVSPKTISDICAALHLTYDEANDAYRGNKKLITSILQSTYGFDNSITYPYLKLAAHQWARDKRRGVFR